METGYLNIVDAHGQPIPAATLGENSFESSYDGATTGTRLGSWGLYSGGHTSAVANSITNLRSRARTLYRNNPMVKGAVTSFVSNLVGTDISPRWDLEDEKQRDELHGLWADSVPEMDYYNDTDFYGQEEQVCRAMINDGEALARLHDMPPDCGLLVPLMVQLMEADHLDPSYNDIAPNGNEIRYAIEWNKDTNSPCRRSAYWLYGEHPGEHHLTAPISGRVRVPAADMLHVFKPERLGQARAGSWLAPVLVKLRDIDIYDDAELVRKKFSAILSGAVYTDSPVSPKLLNGQPGVRSGGKQQIKLQAGSMPVLKDGQKIEWAKSADVGNNYKDFIKIQWLQFARGLGLTYEQATGDLSDVNYSSIRAGLLEFRRLCETIQARTLIFQFCRPVANRWVKTAVLNGVTKTISIAEYLANPRKFHRITWQPDGWDYTNPIDDRIAEQMDVRNGFDSRSAIVNRRGRNVEDVDKETAADIKRAGDHNLVYDSNPVQTTKSGAIQKAEDRAVSGANRDK